MRAPINPIHRWTAASSLVAVAALVAACGSGSAKPPAGSVSPSSSMPTRSTAGTSGGGAPSSGGASSGGASSGGASGAPVGPAGGPVPAGFAPSSTTFVSASLGWALGTTARCSSPPCTSIVRTRDGGRSWQGIPAPRAALLGSQSGNVPAGTVHTIRFADPADGWVAGRTLYATHDGGASWHPVSLGATNAEVSSMGTAGGRVYAAVFDCAGEDCFGAGAVYTAEVGSDRWTKVATVAQAKTSRTDLVVTSAGWYLPLSTGIEHGSGTSAPRPLANPCRPESGSAPAAPTVAAADAQHLDAICGGDGAAGSERYQLYGSTDGGQHWLAAGPARILPSNLTGLADNGSGVLLVACASGGSEIFRSTDDGATLPSVLGVGGGGLPWADLGFTNAQQAVVVQANAGMYLSHDSGAHWTRVSF